MQNKHRSLICIPLLILWGALTLSSCGKSDKNPAAAHGGPALTPEVSVLTIQPERVSVTTELSGRVSAFLVAEVRPQVGGIIQKVMFTEGSEVAEGDVLYQIDPALYKADFDSARAALSRAEALLPSAVAKAKRYKELSEANAISQQEYDDADAAAKRAQADVISAKAAMDRARINLAYTEVKAPISGRIGKSSITTGALVSAFQSMALATIQKLDPVYVDVTQSSTNMLKLKRSLEKGLLKKDAETQARVTLILEDGSTFNQEGVLKFSDVTVDEGTGSVILRSVFPNPDLTLLPGMFVRTVVQEGINEQAIVVPQRAVTRNTKGIPTATIVNAEGIVEIRELQIDRALGNRWLLSGGLAEGDRVIMEGIQKVRPGAPAKTVPFGAPAEKPVTDTAEK